MKFKKWAWRCWPNPSMWKDMGIHLEPVLPNLGQFEYLKEKAAADSYVYIDKQKQQLSTDHHWKLIFWYFEIELIFWKLLKEKKHAVFLLFLYKFSLGKLKSQQIKVTFLYKGILSKWKEKELLVRFNSISVSVSVRGRA